MIKSGIPLAEDGVYLVDARLTYVFNITQAGMDRDSLIVLYLLDFVSLHVFCRPLSVNS